MNNTVIAYFTALIYFHSGIDDAVLAYDHSISQIHLRIYLGSASYSDLLSDIGQCTDIDSFIQFGGPGYSGREGSAATLFGLEGVEKIQKGGYGLIRIVNFDQCCRYAFLRFE